jgi:MFS family permease
MNRAISHPTAPRSLAPAELSTPLLHTTWADRAALLIAVAAALHLAVAAATGLSDTEAYYAQWARAPALSYYDHPPLVAWMTWLATRLSSAPWAIRLGPVLCAAAFDAFVYRLTARLFSPRAGFFAVAIVSAIPVFFFSGFLLNPEAMLAPLWTLGLLVLVDLRERDAAWRAIALGGVIGLAFLAKYTAVLAVPVVLLSLGSSPESRRWFKRPSLYLAGLLALAITTPVLVWNARHGWPSLHLHLSERMERPASETLGAALWRVGKGQLLFFSPLFLPALAGVLAVTLVRSRHDERYRFLASASLPVLGFLLTMMVRAGDSEPHWTMVGYIPLAIAAGGLLDESMGLLRRVARAAFGAAFLLSAAVAALYAVHLRTPALAKLLRSYDPAADPFAETIGWDRVRAGVASHAAALGPGTVTVAAHNVLCGHLQAATDDSPPVYCASARRTQFDFVGRRSPPDDAPVVFVDSERYPEDPAAALPNWMCGPVESVEIERSGLRQGRYRLRDCRPLGGGAR